MWPVHGIQLAPLRISLVGCVVAAATTKIDPAHECDVRTAVGGSQKDQLLMVRSRAPHPLVQKDLAPRFVDDSGQIALGLLIEAERLRM